MTDPPDHRDHRDDFAAFFEKEYKSVVAALMRAGATFEDAEDAVVETMTIAARRFDRLTTPGAWVRVVAMRRFIRKRQRDRERELREQLAAALSAPPQPEDPDLVRLVRSILDDLPPTQCIVMALHMEGYSCPEIASMLGSSQDTIRSNLRYARRAMAIGLKKGGWNFS